MVEPIEGDFASDPTSDPGDVPASAPTEALLPTDEVVVPADEPIAAPAPVVPAPVPSTVTQLQQDQAATQALNAQLEAATTEAHKWAGTSNTEAYDAAVAEVSRLEKLRG